MIRFLVLLVLFASAGYAEPLRIAVASSMQRPMKEIAEAFNKTNPNCEVQIIVGSSGKLTAQIMNGAPYDMFFSADMSYPEYLEQQGRAVTPAQVYADGLLVMWAPDIEGLRLLSLINDSIYRIAIANPKTAPYGRATEETLKTAGLYGHVQDKLVYAENVAQVMHFVESGAAEVGFAAMSLLASNTNRESASFVVLNKYEYNHEPIRHGFVSLVDTKENTCAGAFLSYLRGTDGADVLTHYGFEIPLDIEALMP